MRSVRLNRAAFLNGALYDAGSVITISDDEALAPYMTEIPPEPIAPDPAAMPAAVVAPSDKAVTVHYDATKHAVDIDVEGVSTHIDHATLQIKTD